MHPDFINEAVYFDEEGNEVKIFPKWFINKCKMSYKNSSVPLTTEQKNHLNTMAFNAGHHRHQRVRKIRYYYQQQRKQKKKKANGKNQRQLLPEKWYWQVMTEDKQVYKIDDDWVELNLVYHHRNWYIDHLEPQKTDKSKNQTEWKELPCGSSFKVLPQEDEKKLSNTSNDKVENESEISITEFVTTVKHKYLQKDYGDVCTVINVLNLMVYLEDNHAEEQLLPLLNQKEWNKYLKSLKAKK